jgi:hypothetical protein
MELGALLAFEKAMYPSSHLSTSCPCTSAAHLADTSLIAENLIMFGFGIS